MSIDMLAVNRHVVSMSIPATSTDRQDAILGAACATFASYGFQRTSMADIARRAGMSRSALYLHYRNKEDIFRSLTQRFFEQAVADVALALAADGSAEERLAAAFAAKDGPMMEVVLGTPHGSELMDAGFAIGGDIVAEGEAKIAALLAEWLARRRLPEGIGTPEEIAVTLVAALNGLKASASDFHGYRAGQNRLARLFGRAISP
jgi:AcrR family transcriptional regulator